MIQLSIRHRAMAVMAVCLGVVVPNLSACHLFQSKEQQRMSYIQNVELNYGVQGTSYNIDNYKGVVRIEEIEGQNYMLDAQGKVVKLWFGLPSGGWGIGASTPIGGSPSPARLAKTVHLGYYDTVEQQAYTAEFDLPQERIYELLQLKTVDYGATPAEVIPRFHSIKIGIAPKGYIIVWVTGTPQGDQVEIGQYWAKPIPFDIAAYNYNNGKYRSFEIREGADAERAYWKPMCGEKASDYCGFAPETIAKLKSGWKPDYSFYEQARTLYPWRIDLKGKWQLTDYEIWYLAGGHESIFSWRMKDEQAPKLRGVPMRLVIYFNDDKGQRYKVWMEFFHQDRVRGEEDLSVVWDALKTLSPNRTYQDNNKPVTEADMARMELEIDDAMDNLTVHLVKGNQRIKIPVYDDTLTSDLVPNDYYTPDMFNKPRTPEELHLLQFGPQSSVPCGTCKVNEVCPRTGMWYCEGVSPEAGIYMRKGDIMPGQSYSKETQAQIEWHLIKPMDNT